MPYPLDPQLHYQLSALEEYPHAEKVDECAKPPHASVRLLAQRD